MSGAAPFRQPWTFISRTDIGYLTTSSLNDPIHGTSKIARMSLTDMKAVPVVTVQGDVPDFKWSPDGSTLAYLLETADPNYALFHQLWLKVGSAAPKALTPLMPVCGYGSVDDQTIVRFSHDGKYLLTVDTPVSGAFQVRSVPDGAFVWAPPAEPVAFANKGGSYRDIPANVGGTCPCCPGSRMAVWSHQSDRLYYRGPAAGIHAWDPTGTVGTVVAGLSWYSPSVSPADRLVAYTLDAGGPQHIEVRDLVTSSVRAIPGKLGQPILLSDDELIESHFEHSGGQVGQGTTGVYILNLLTNVETPLLVGPTFENPEVIDTWPR